LLSGATASAQSTAPAEEEKSQQQQGSTAVVETKTNGTEHNGEPNSS